VANLTQTALPDAIKTMYEKRLLTRAVPRFVHGRWGKLASLNKFGSYELRKYGSLSAISSALSEGATPAEQTAPTLTLTTITPLFYGSWLGWTDELELTVFDPLISEMSAILGEQAGLSADTILRNTLTDGATVDYAGTATSRATVDAPQHYVTYADFVKQLALLQGANALPLEGQNFVVIMHPDSYATLMLDPVFVNMFVQETADFDIRSGYMGRILNCNIYVSSNAREYANEGVGSTTDVYSMLFIGQEALGYLGFGNITPDMADAGGAGYANNTGKSVRPVEIIIKQLGSGGATDPLNQRATVGWKMALAATVLNADWIRNLEHATIASDD
jgi:N4-gp56 family major capsid protein